ncbi:hypothetical protein [Ralstonia pseudosolanacearum]|uniref:hypothetical protein n=1 Tax=Ralstonia pseudosolanacearum TaxID=1310165 RepID=UPI003CE9551D
METRSMDLQAAIKCHPKRPYHFIRTHIPTGSQYAGNFNGTHHMYWGGDEWKHTSLANLSRTAFDLIKRWNSARPENTLWHYEVADGPAPAPSH